MKEEIIFEEHRDYLEEMMNIGAGNAAGALEEILKLRVDMVLPSVYILSPPEVISVVGEPDKSMTCVKMNMVGDVKGELFFMVPYEQIQYVLELAHASMDPEQKKSYTPDLSIIMETGNILAGVYLTAINNFCRLNIYHTVPILATDMVQSLLDETVARLGLHAKIVIVVVNKFALTRQTPKALETFLIMIPASGSEKILMDSMREAKKLCGR